MGSAEIKRRRWCRYLDRVGSVGVARNARQDAMALYPWHEIRRRCTKLDTPDGGDAEHRVERARVGI